MPRSPIDASIDIIREVDFCPRRNSALADAVGRNINLGRYLDLLTQSGYLAANIGGLYECTPKGRKALGAYDGLLESGLVTEEDGIRVTDLEMLRELGDGNYKAAVAERSRYIIKKRLMERGFVRESGVTDKGRKFLELTTDLFELGESWHAYAQRH